MSRCPGMSTRLCASPPGSTNSSIKGGGRNNHAFEVDGVNTNAPNQIFGEAYISWETIVEVEIVTGGIGAGPIGNLTAQACKGFGASAVLITDLSDSRLSIARECGVEFTANPGREDLAEALETAFGPDRPGAVFECVGSETTIGQAVSLARKGTDIVVVGVFSSRPAVDIGFVQDKELRLIGSLMYREDDSAAAVRMIQEGRVRLQPLMSRHFPFKEYPAAYKYIESEGEKVMKVFMDL